MKWISVKERLPEHKEIVLVAIPDQLLIMVNHVAEFYREYSNDHIWQTINSSHQAYTIYANIEGVTHWMPLPEPPTE